MWKNILAAALISASAHASLAQGSPEIQVMLLETQLDACYVPPATRATPADHAMVELTIDSSGALIGAPRNRLPSTASAGAHAILEAATSAMQSCLLTRPDPEGELVVFQALFALDGVTVVALTEGEGGYLTAPESTAPGPEPLADENASGNSFQDDISSIIGGTIAKSPLEQLLSVVESSGPSSEYSETGMALTRTERREIQGRLVSLGYDTRGVDGVFGAGSRAGISDWQQEMPVAATGYLNRPQLDYLNALTEETYPKWLAARAPARPRVFRGSDGCVRTRNDQRTRFIILGRSGYCNLRALGLARPRQ